jgi:hypothetical protein
LTIVGFEREVPDLRALGRAASFRAAVSSIVLSEVTAEISRARSSREVNISPFLRDWSHGGIVGHLNTAIEEIRRSCPGVCPVGRGIQRWVAGELRQQLTFESVDRALAKRLSSIFHSCVSCETAGLVRGRVFSLRTVMPPVVLSSILRSCCNAWTTTGRFSGPTLACPFGCGAAEGDKFSHFAGCGAIRRMWAEACPSSDPSILVLTLELVLLITPEMSDLVISQAALWSDVVGHCANDIRMQGLSPERVFREGGGMFTARLRQLAVQSDSARAVICLIRAA